MDTEVEMTQDTQEAINDITRRIATGARIQTIIEAMRYNLNLLDELELGEDARDGSKCVNEVIGMLVPDMMQALKMMEDALDLYAVCACMDSGYRD